MKKKRRKLSVAGAIASAINRELGTDIRLGSDPYFQIERISSGSLVMDRVLGGGFARGRHYELYGDESVGKSYIQYRTMALAQQRGEICALVDPEHYFDADRFAFLGGDPDELLLQQPDTAEDSLAAMMLLAQNATEHNISVIGIDSVASLLTKEEREKDPRDEDRVASQARMMSRALRRLTTVTKKTTFIWTNQERTNIGIRFGNPRTQSGGRALRYYATGRIEMRRGTQVKDNRTVVRGTAITKSPVQVGRWIQIRAEKEKSSRPYREGSFIFSIDTNNIDIGSEILHLGLVDGLIQKTSKGFLYVDNDGDEWKGSEKQMMRWLRENEFLQQELIPQIEENTIQQERPNGADDDQDV